MIMLVSVIMAVALSSSIEWEGVGQTLLIPATLTFNWGHGDQAYQDC
jgi:hypothetical protein